MSKFFLGSTELTDASQMFYGSDPVKALFFGSTKLWPASQALYVVDSSAADVWTIPLDTGVPALLGLSGPTGSWVATTVDSTGAVYVSTLNPYELWKFTGAVGSSINIGSRLAYQGVAVDSADNVYFGFASPTIGVAKIDGSGTITNLGFTGLSGLVGVAVDSSGAVYVSDNGNKAVYKLDASGQTTLGFTGLASPFGVAVDSSGAVYVSDNGNKAVYKLDASGQTTLGFTGLASPLGVAVDSSGAVYVSDNGNNAVYKWDGATQTKYAIAGSTPLLMSIGPVQP